MTYALAGALQAAVYAQLQSYAPLTAIVGDAVHDKMPSGALPPIYVAFGPERVEEAGDQTGAGAWHQFEVSVVTENAGFLSAKEAAAAVSDALHDADLTLGRGRLVGLWFHKARASLAGEGRRRIDLTFRARVEDN
ncbi:DUF3168 domain-containing protein [Sagittula sp. MA-2]|jgi:hypothetical protein|uniref:DUF3168 domain-containing protein n=1 Tax=Sagittula sp. MA-2 TaxID=3048007 RepID=UPI0024C419A6|nr:DUF3168 domain-containing protein [Sagittula sp. MA-2]WHZ36941.1 DUF3168 domain-containing protein [Sagittula sp. MA-2]